MRPAALAFRTPLAVLIDDNIAARPQAGFNAASLVYQAPADGGETRYMLVFQGQDAPTIGPVRSGRPFFLRWAAEYRSGWRHYGGDYMTLGQTIPQLGRDVHLRHRRPQRVRRRLPSGEDTQGAANGYTNTGSLRAVGTRRGMPATQHAGFGVRAYVDDASLADRPASSTISVPYAAGRPATRTIARGTCTSARWPGGRRSTRATASG